MITLTLLEHSGEGFREGFGDGSPVDIFGDIFGQQRRGRSRNPDGIAFFFFVDVGHPIITGTYRCSVVNTGYGTFEVA